MWNGEFVWDLPPEFRALNGSGSAVIWKIVVGSRSEDRRKSGELLLFASLLEEEKDLTFHSRLLAQPWMSGTKLARCFGFESPTTGKLRRSTTRPGARAGVE
jgi:hypothetical protein